MLFVFSGAVVSANAQSAPSMQLFQQGTANPAFTTNSFSAVEVTKHGVVWAGSLNQGLYRLDTRAAVPQWVRMTQMTNATIRDIEGDRQGGTWIAHTGQSPASTAITGGMDYYDSLGTYVTHYGALASAGNLQTRAARSVHIAPDQRVWVANASTLTGGITDKGGFSRFQPGDTQFTPSTANVPGLDGSCQAVGGGGIVPEVWIAMNRSCPASGPCFSTRLLRYSAAGLYIGHVDNTNSSIPIDNVSSTVQVRAIHFDKFNRAWVGLSTGGFAVCNLALPSSAWTYISNPAIVPAGAAININAIASDNTGNVYIGTTQGLVVYTAGADPMLASSYTRYTTQSGLPSDFVNSIAIDASTGDRWLATTAGLVRWSNVCVANKVGTGGTVHSGSNGVVGAATGGEPQVKYAWNVSPTISGFVTGVYDSSPQRMVNVFPTVSTPTDYTFTLTARDTITSCSRNTQVVVTVLPLPNAGANRQACANTTTTLGTSGPHRNENYTWTVSPSLAASIDTVARPTVSLPTVTTPTRYTFTQQVKTRFNVNTRFHTDEVEVEVLPEANFTASAASPTIEECGNTTISVTPNVPGYTYSLTGQGTGTQWTVQPTVTTTYTITGTNGLCTPLSHQVTVTVNELRPITAVAVPDTITLGQSVSLMGQSVGGTQPGVTFSWTGVGLQSTTGASVSAIPTSIGKISYSVTATNTAGCTESASVTVEVVAPAPANGPTGPFLVCSLGVCQTQTPGPNNPPPPGPNTGPNATVTVQGNNMGGLTGVSVGGVAGTIGSNSGTMVTFTVPTLPCGTQGPVPIRAHFGNGQSTIVGYVSVTTPCITFLAPSQGPVGTQVDIHGRNFRRLDSQTNTVVPQISGVHFNGITGANFLLVSDTLARADVPTGASTGLVTLLSTMATGAGVQFTVTQPVTLTNWTGAVDNNWNNSANWSAGVPTAAIDVVLPGGLATYPQLTSGTATLGNLTLQPGSSLLIGNAVLTLHGNLTNQGGSLTQTAGRVVLAGASLQTLAGTSPTRFLHLEVGSAGALLTGPVEIGGVLQLTGNLASNGNLTLLSNAAGTAVVVNSATGVVTGSVTVQRYINPSLNSGLGYRHLASPVQGATVGGLTTASFTPVVNPAYNTGGGGAFPTIFGYDERRLASTSSPSFDTGWFSPTATSEVLVPGRGYTVNLAPQRLALAGTLNNGPVSLSLTRGVTATSGWHLLGNPYPAIIDWNLIALPSGVENALYVFRSTGQYTGGYQPYVNGVGTANANLIGLGQAFFVRATAPATFTFTNAARLTVASQDVPVYRTTETRPLLALALQAPGVADDVLYVYQQAGATSGFDAAFDAVKVQLNSGSQPSLYTSTSTGEYLAIQGLPDGVLTQSLPLAVNAPVASVFSFNPQQLINFPAATSLLLEDKQTNQWHNLRQGAYAVQLPQGLTSSRFVLHLNQQRPLGTASNGPAGASLTIYPNPTTQRTVHLEAAGLPGSAADIFIVNALGQEVAQKHLVLTGRSFVSSLELPLLPAGMYSVQIRTSGGVVVRKLLLN
jgi:hypothetical protein